MPKVAGGPNYSPPVAAGGGGGGSALEVDDEGVSLDTAVTSIDFAGAGVTATNVGHAITVTVPATAEADLATHLADAVDAHDASAISADSTTLVGTGTDVQAVLEELDNGIADHLADTSAAHAASAISADSTTLVGTGTDVQAVLEELDNGIADHLADTADAHDASAISILDTAANFTATDVEAALIELQTKVLPGVWLNDTDTWVYNDATSFTITGKDVTARFPRGTRVSYNDGAVDYGVVGADATVVGSDTVVELMENNDYAIANAALTAPRYSYDTKPPSYPYYFAYTEVHTGYSANPTMGLNAALNTKGDLQVLCNPTAAGTSNNATHSHENPKVNGSAVTTASSVKLNGFSFFPSRGIDNNAGQGYAAYWNTGTTAFNTGRISDLANTAANTSRPGAVVMAVSLA